MPEANECPRCGADWIRHDSPLVLLNKWACQSREYSSPHTFSQSSKCRISELEKALQKVLMCAQPEEPVGLRHALDLERGVQRASPGVEVALGAKGLASDAVPSVVAVLVKRVGMPLGDSADEMRHACRVVRRSGAHESVVGDA